MASDPIAEYEAHLTEQLERLRPVAMSRAGYRSTTTREVASFHGVIGGKNNTFVDAVRQVFLSPQQFIGEWIEGVLRQARLRDHDERRKYGRVFQSTAAHRILRMLQDPYVLEYICLFLERNFYREYAARTRTKPEDALWSLWFGGKNQEYGLLITPRFRDGTWENDVSEIRRADFDYWTVGHVLSSGFVVEGRNRAHRFRDIGQLFDFYHNVLVRATGSPYSKMFAERYEQHVRRASDPLAVPFLLPEWRYEGVASGPHGYRLDYAVLSASRGTKLGVELSPWSTHGRVVGKKALREKGGEAAVEEAQRVKWEKDKQKRNDYFRRYGVTVLTLTDTDLADMERAFAQVAPYLDVPVRVRTADPVVDAEMARYVFEVPPDDH